MPQCHCEPYTGVIANPEEVKQSRKYKLDCFTRKLVRNDSVRTGLLRRVAPRNDKTAVSLRPKIFMR